MRSSPARSTEYHFSFSEIEAIRDTKAEILLPIEQAEPDRPTLTVLSGVHAGQTFVLDAPEVLIGRAPHAHVFLTDDGLSRHHARILARDDGSYLVEDLGSTNGTFVGRARIKKRVLSSGDRVQFGPNISMRLSIVDSGDVALATQLYEASTRDALTRAYNRKYFLERLAAEMAYAQRHRTPVGVVVFDIDHFKTVNDTHGHAAGDSVLREVAARVAATVRTEDVFARHGGEEFAVLVRGVAREGMAAFAERLRQRIEGLDVSHEPERDGSGEWRLGEATHIAVTISAGVASLEEIPTGSAPGLLLALADERMYDAKKAGRNRVVAG